MEARFHRACPWDKPGLSQGQSRGRRAAQKVYVKKVYVPFSLAIRGDSAAILESALRCQNSSSSGKSKGGPSKGGLGPKGANWAKKGPFGAISALPPWLWGAEELVPIGPEKAPIGPEFAPRRPDFAGRISPRFSLKIWGLSPPL